MKNILFVSIFFIFLGVSAQETPSRSEFLVVRVQYGKTMAGYKYEVFVDIGVSGSHSLSGQLVNNQNSVTITDDTGKYEFKSDMDLLNYLSKNGWQLVETGQIDILDQHYNTYLMQKSFSK